MSKREKNKAENRIKLIRSAAAAFAEQGVKGANINLISLGAGLGKGTVYNYFPSKTELFLAVLEQAGSELAGEIKEAVTIEQPGMAQFKQLISGLLAHYAKQPDMSKMLIRAVAAHRVTDQQAALAAMEPFLNRLQDCLIAGAEQRVLREDLDPFLSAVTVWGMINHQAAFHWLVSNRPLDPEGLTELIMTYFLSGAKASQS